MRHGKSGALRFVVAQLPETLCVPRFLRVTAACWRVDAVAFLRRCSEIFPDTAVAVRSDAWSEDASERTHAGEFRTVLDVPAARLRNAIDLVVASLPGHPGDAVIVQAMVRGIVLAGVASTHRIADGAPYYTLELAPLDSAAVTSGRAVVRQVAVSRAGARDVAANPALAPEERAAFAVLRDVETLYGSMPLEIEVALAADVTGTRAHLLQVRALSASRRSPSTAQPPKRVMPLDFVHERDPEARIAGRGTLLSLMSDWNPAELLGAHPRPLARTIFENVIARDVWWRARAAIGYRTLADGDLDLLRIVHGRPYVDVRRSANSLLPAGLAPGACEELVDACVERLRERPMLHDKVEFEVFRTVRDFAAASAVRRQWSAIGSDTWREWDSALLQLSRRLVDVGAHSPLNRSLDTLARLDSTAPCTMPWRQSLAHARGAALAFAALARLAFAGEVQVRSAIAHGALTGARAGELRASARRAAAAFRGVAATDTTRSLCLREGMFDICCAPRSAAPASAADAEPFSPFALGAAETADLTRLLDDSGFLVSPSQWVRFVQMSAWAREHGKYVLGRFVSAALDDIGAMVEEVDCDLDCASWLTLDDAAAGERLGLRARSAFWARRASAAAARHREDGLLIMSPVLIGDADRDVARMDGAFPNFVGQRAIEGPMVRVVAAGATEPRSLRGAVAVIAHADPGYDWLFGTGIAGLLTAWGGANSHLAIRCAEIGATAALGCGEAVFVRALAANRVRIDPGAGSIWFE